MSEHDCVWICGPTANIHMEKQFFSLFHYPNIKEIVFLGHLGCNGKAYFQKENY